MRWPAQCSDAPQSLVSRKAGARTLRPSDTLGSIPWPEALVPWLSGRWQPLHSIYARSCLEAVDNMLAATAFALETLRIRPRKPDAREA